MLKIQKVHILNNFAWIKKYTQQKEEKRKISIQIFFIFQLDFSTHEMNPTRTDAADKRKTIWGFSDWKISTRTSQMPLYYIPIYNILCRVNIMSCIWKEKLWYSHLIGSENSEMMKKVQHVWSNIEQISLLFSPFLVLNLNMIFFYVDEVRKIPAVDL